MPTQYNSGASAGARPRPGSHTSNPAAIARTTLDIPAETKLELIPAPGTLDVADLCVVARFEGGACDLAEWQFPQLPDYIGMDDIDAVLARRASDVLGGPSLVVLSGQPGDGFRTADRTYAALLAASEDGRVTVGLAAALLIPDGVEELGYLRAAAIFAGGADTVRDAAAMCHLLSSIHLEPRAMT